MNRYFAFLRFLEDRYDFVKLNLIVLLRVEFPNLSISDAENEIKQWNKEGRPGA